MATAVAPRVVFSSSIKMETVADLKKLANALTAEPHSWTAAMHILDIFAARLWVVAGVCQALLPPSNFVNMYR